MVKPLKDTQLKNVNIEKMVKALMDKGPAAPVIGQERAVKALRFGLEVEAQGYNVYLAGEMGHGRHTAALHYATEKAKNRPIPMDLCYVYAFDQPKVPKLLSLPAGMGQGFKTDIGDLIHELSVELPKTLNGDELSHEKMGVFKQYNQRRDEMVEQITAEAKVYDFGVRTTSSGIYFMPIIEGVMITEEDYDGLEEALKEKIQKDSQDLHENLGEVMDTIREYELMSKKEVTEMEYSYLLFVVGKITDGLLQKYAQWPEVLVYLKALKEHVLAHPEAFSPMEMEGEEALFGLLPWAGKKEEEPYSKYQVNVIVDNSGLTHAPVIVGHRPSHQNLVGEVEFDNEYGNFITDFMKIKGGLFHQAHGGYLIIDVEDLNIFGWEALFRTLKTQEVVIEPIKELMSIAVNGVEPEALKGLDVKVILVGSFEMYDLLQYYHDDFRKLFKIRGDFDHEMPLSQENLEKVWGYLQDFSAQKALPFTIEAVIALVEAVVRESGRQTKMVTDFGFVHQVITEAYTWAKLEEKSQIEAQDIATALLARRERSGLYESKLTELINEAVLMIDTQGKKVGQVNGLAVLDMGDYAFGKPTRITATSFAGSLGVVNIEKEAELSGRIHNKGVNILAGYLGSMYAKEFPLSVSIHIGFEQNYHGIDGDSASSTELFAIMSSLAEVGIDQGIAVTGSMNQHGEIQAIGGATEKIEGFFDTCVQRGLTGNQGVIIPVQNVKDLFLKPELIEAVKAGQFAIYPIRTVDEGIECLTGLSAQVVHEKIKVSLKKYSDIAKAFEEEEAEEISEPKGEAK